MIAEMPTDGGCGQKARYLYAPEGALRLPGTDFCRFRRSLPGALQSVRICDSMRKEAFAFAKALVIKMNDTEIHMLLEHAHTLYFIGIGGVSMSSLAAIAQERGYLVRGSDRMQSAVTEHLAERGIPVYPSHRPEQVEGADAVVYTAAIREDNPELMHARELGIPCISRAVFLGWLMTGYRNRIGIAGTHGKSTTTSMCAEILMAAGVDPTVVSGAALNDMHGCYRVGSRDFFLFEACEYTDSFLSFYPTTAVVTNVDLDHADYFHTLERVEQSFHRYIGLAEQAIVNWDDPNVRVVTEGYPGRVISFGLEAGDASYRAEGIQFVHAMPSFDIYAHGAFLTHAALHIPGKHNIYDALAAAAAAHENGIDAESIRKGLEQFRGAKRRFEFRGTVNGAALYEDYAHHPSEIRATLAAARQFGKRILCVFQPHTYSRTAELFDGFVSAFGDADEVVFADIYAAREANTYGVSSCQLAQHVKNARYLDSFEKIASYIRENAREGDMVFLMGAGDIIRVEELLSLH